MVRVKTPSSPPPTSGGGDEESERFDLFTPDTLSLVGTNRTPRGARKRSVTAYSASPSAKRANTVASASARASAASRASTASRKKKTAQSNSSPKPRAQAPKFIFGFDFGTTYTGIAYAYSGDAKKIEIMMSWDDTNDDHVKIPSAIKFDDPIDIWGVDAKHRSDALRWFKLTLVNPSDLDVGVRNSIQIQDARAALQSLEMEPEEAISAYLKHVWERCIEKLKEAEGEETVDTSRFHVVFTIPAIWPNYARKRMEQAVKDAGILKRRPAGRTDHDFVYEPEAAALAMLSGIQGRHNIKIGDTLVVVDCGGGTVDIITYKISSTDPMSVQEVVKGKGALCGAIFVDERFKELLIRKLEAIHEDAMAMVSEAEIQEIMTRNWENEIRNQFNGQDQTWTIRQPYSLIAAGQLDHNRGYPQFAITSAEVEEIFRPIIEKIHSLVDRQISAAVKKQGRAPKYVILVGGFGSCKYLREYLKSRCEGTEILQGRGSVPWSAISRGAVIEGLTKLKIDTPFTVDVKSRISRASYGTVCEVEYDDGVHLEEDKVFDPALQKYVVPGVMKWLVSQGQDIYVDRNPSFNFTKFLSEPPKKIETIIYRSLAADPPARRDNSVREVFKLTWDTQVDWDSLEPLHEDRPEAFKKLEYTVQMKCSAGVADFSIYHGGYKQAGKNVSLEFYETADI